MEQSSTATLDKKTSGFGRLLVVVYAVFTLSAGARSLYQVIRKFDEAPLSITLSAISALIYLVATIALAKKGRGPGKCPWERWASRW